MVLQRIHDRREWRPGAGPTADVSMDENAARAHTRLSASNPDIREQTCVMTSGAERYMNADQSDLLGHSAQL